MLINVKSEKCMKHGRFEVNIVATSTDRIDAPIMVIGSELRNQFGVAGVSLTVLYEKVGHHETFKIHLGQSIWTTTLKYLTIDHPEVEDDNSRFAGIEAYNLEVSRDKPEVKKEQARKTPVEKKERKFRID